MWISMLRMIMWNLLVVITHKDDDDDDDDDDSNRESDFVKFSQSLF